MSKLFFKKLCTSEHIDDSCLPSKLVFELSSKLESVFLTCLSDVPSLIFSGHLVEDDPTSFGEEWLRPEQYISDVGCCSRCDDIIFALVIWVLCEILGPILDRLDSCEFHLLHKMTHSLDLFTDAIEECHIELRDNYLERNTWESSSGTNIQQTDW